MLDVCPCSCYAKAMTLLTELCERENPRTVRLLVQRGCSIRISSVSSCPLASLTSCVLYKYKRRPLHVAASNSNIETVRVLCEEFGSDPLLEDEVRKSFLLRFNVSFCRRETQPETWRTHLVTKEWRST